MQAVLARVLDSALTTLPPSLDLLQPHRPRAARPLARLATRECLSHEPQHARAAVPLHSCCPQGAYDVTRVSQVERASDHGLWVLQHVVHVVTGGVTHGCIMAVATTASVGTREATSIRCTVEATDRHVTHA